MAVVLAAGQGTRLLPLTERRPKCLVAVNGTPILINALAQLAARGVERVRVVVGHLEDVVKAEIPGRHLGMQVDLVANPDFASTNSMYSLALGLDGVAEDTWVLEGDVYFEGALLDNHPPADIAWMIDARRRDLDGAYVYFDANGVATRLEIVRNGATPGDSCGKSVGILRMSRAGVETGLRWLRRGIAQGKQGLYYDLIFAEHLGAGGVRVSDVSGRRWFEIDTPGDLARAEDMFR
jgi:choline kinase